MWKANIGMSAAPTTGDDNDDDWETDPDFVNDVSEQEQRWGSKTVDGSGRTVAAVDMSKLREEVEQSDNRAKKKQMEEMPNAAYGYGGKFGVQKDRMDQSAVGHDYIGKVEKHESQKDYSTGFGGKFGIQTDRVDKSAVSWDHKEKVEKHTSQKDYTSGFGGKFGVETDRVDKSAVGWDHMEKASKHESQKDYTVGFGGKFGVQTDRQDKSAMGWDHHESVQKHESQTDHKKGFGGKFGVQTDRVDKSAVGFDEPHEKIGTSYTKFKPDIGGVKPSSLRAKFENMAKENEELALKKAKDEREKRLKEEQKERDDDRSRNKNFNTGLEDKEGPRPGVKSAINTGRESSIQTNVKLFSPNKTDQKVQGPPKMIEIEKSSPALEPYVSSPVEENGKIPDIVQGTHKADIVEEKEPEPITKEIKSAVPTAVESPVTDNEDSPDFDGYIAVALYDYQAAAPDEISFDPDDVISHIEMIDEGWWRGLCKDQYGLFPANYVQLQEK